MIVVSGLLCTLDLHSISDREHLLQAAEMHIFRAEVAGYILSDNEEGGKHRGWRRLKLRNDISYKQLNFLANGVRRYMYEPAFPRKFSEPFAKRNKKVKKKKQMKDASQL